VETYPTRPYIKKGGNILADRGFAWIY